MSVTEHAHKNHAGPGGGRVRSFLALGAVLGIGTAVTLAQFTDSGDVVAEFSTGSVDIAFDGDNEGNPEPYVFTSLSLDNAGPGDTVVAPLEVNNNGSLDFDYAMDTEVGPLGDGDQAEADALAAALELTIVGVGSAAACDEAAFDAPGDPVFGPAALPGGEIAEPGRFLAEGDSEVLCFRVDVGEAAPQGAGATAVFGFLATQSS
ncbi:hypothetical protein G1H11_00980 [Phytoactinopolyspora alkaliphila]|uniref:SipW-cognate class signal peptide n=1 Tax=Phytoactinopolyspora alkaliphila TaxID=1783498 RepID=A0A6N9YG44_9ACTN|nr:TasA family protein [Phytoactinopolyspora alkaliphila]NED93885.1 hypothetical protein [Phytoactinopolyspora alkaliphila]